MENKKKCLSRLPTIKPQPLANVPALEEQNKCPARRLLSRRSKSFSDLRTASNPLRRPLSKFNVNNPLPTIPAHKVFKTNTANPSKGAIKRTAPTPIVEQPKPKVSKPSKPAPYDYKARFNLLSEKHTDLVKIYKDLKATAAEMELQLQNHRNLETNFNNLEQVRLTLENENKVLKKENEVLRKRTENLEKLEIDHFNLTSNHEILTSKYKKLEADSILTKRSLNETLDYVNELKSAVQEHELNRRVMHNKIQDLKGNIRVFCRIRPPLESEEFHILSNINCIDEESIEIQKSNPNSNTMASKLEFNFDKVFPQDASQSHVFEELSYLVQSALDGYHVCVFAYGQTGSGKTHTMQGGDDEISKGMIPRTINLIFELKTNLEKLGWIYKVEVSFLEIYNETIKDLMDPNSQIAHEIRFNQGQGTTVTNLTVKEVDSAHALLYLMTLANRNRATAATNFNQHSSRSHSVTKITIRGTNKELKLCYFGSLNLVDLAGSENAKNSERMTETKNINKSLSTLGTVMTSLHNKEQHVPYRNSKLTYLLQSCLGGNSKTLMFVNIAPLEECFSESLNSLRFASKVKEVKLGSKRNFNKK